MPLARRTLLHRSRYRTVGGLLLGTSTLEGDIADSLQAESNVLAINGKSRRALVRDTTTPANAKHVDMSGATDFLTYTAPSIKRITHADRLVKFAAHNLFLSSDAPATQNITVISGASYKVKITGSGQIALSGAGTGTVTDGSPVTITAATTTLTCTVSGGPSTAMVFRNPAEEKYLATGASAARYALPVTHDASSYDTSTTSITLGAGSHTITKATSGGYSVGDTVRFSAQANVDGQFMVGKVTAASGTSVTFNVPSTDYVTGSGTVASWYIIKVLGIRRERAATNLIETSDFTNATYWSKHSTATIAASTAVNSPDGSTHRLYKYTEADTSTSNALTWAGATISASTNYTQSIYMRADTATWVMGIWRDLDGGSQFFFWVNLATGAKGTLGAGSGRVTAVSHNITTVGGGWYRIDATGSTTGTNLKLLLTYVTADNVTTRAGSNAAAYVWAPQAESGSYPTSPVLTYGSTVTRAADQPNNATSIFPWSATNDLIVMRCKVSKAAELQTLLSLDDGTANEQIKLYLDASANILLQVTDGGATQLAPLDSAVNASDNTWFNVAIRIKANDIAISVDGNTVVKDTSCTLPTVTTLRYGRDVAGNPMTGDIAYVKMTPNEPSDANLVSEST